jgi:cytochrome P450
MTSAAEQPSGPFATDDPYPRYAVLRETAPVYRHPFGFWMLTRYDDVSWLLRAGLSVENRNVADGSLAQLRREAYGEGYPRAKGLSMLDRDPPDHTRLRRLVSKAFNPRAVQALRPRITELVDGMLDPVAAAGRADLVEALAFPLPFTVIAEMLGTPPADHARIRELTGLVVRSLEPVADHDLAAAIIAANTELTGIAAGMIAWKRRHPAGDLLTALIGAEDGGDVLSDEELIAQTLLLYIAGHETTVNLIAGGTLALLRNPGQLALLQRDPALTPNAVEELLRYDSPVQTSRRITLEQVTVRGVTIPRGAFVVASLGAANRDEHFWGPDAAELRLDRQNARQHVSFGGGPHHCLGASLARLEASIAFGRLVARFPRLALDGDVTWNGRMNLRGPARLPVTVRLGVRPAGSGRYGRSRWPPRTRPRRRAGASRPGGGRPAAAPPAGRPK